MANQLPPGNGDFSIPILSGAAAEMEAVATPQLSGQNPVTNPMDPAISTAAGGADIAAAAPVEGRNQPELSKEKWLNFFVRIVATLERVGNALGTVASLWCTVMVLSKSSTKLVKEDSLFTIALLLLEAFR